MTQSMNRRINESIRLHIVSCLVLILSLICKTNAQVSTSLGESCLAVVKDIFEEDRRELLCQTPSGMLYIVPSVDDDWIGQKMNSGVLISGEVYLDISKNTIVDRNTETLVMTEEPTFLASDDESDGRRRRKLAKTLGEKTVLGVRVVASNGALTASENELSQSIFGGPSDLLNLKSQFYACSHGKLNFQKRSDLRGATTSIRNGVVTIKVNLPVEVGSSVMVNAVSETLLREFEISRSEIADHVMYCLPKGVFNGVAYAIMNFGLSVYNDHLCASVSTQMHEVG